MWRTWVVLAHEKDGTLTSFGSALYAGGFVAFSLLMLTILHRVGRSKICNVAMHSSLFKICKAKCLRTTW